MIKQFRGVTPQIHPSAFVADSAQIIGDVQIGAESSVWFNAVLRGDINSIRIGARTNIQDGAVLHVTLETSVVLEDEITVGHSAVVHGCYIERGALIGIGAIILDGARIGAQSLIAAGALVTPNTIVPPRALVMGSPAKVKRELNDEELRMLETRWRGYVEQTKNYKSEERWVISNK
jgi:carbonic anhydrase/acetyltransferase-like protein (isoleucine patch superfamily)